MASLWQVLLPSAPQAVPGLGRKGWFSAAAQWEMRGLHRHVLAGHQMHFSICSGWALTVSSVGLELQKLASRPTLRPCFGKHLSLPMYSEPAGTGSARRKLEPGRRSAEDPLLVAVQTWQSYVHFLDQNGLKKVEGCQITAVGQSQMRSGMLGMQVQPPGYGQPG